MRPAVAILTAALALSATPSARPVVPAGIDPPPASAQELAAANELLAKPWNEIAREQSREGSKAIVQALDGATVASGHGLGWNLKSKLGNISPTIDIAKAPGFTAASFSELAVRLPAAGSWTFGVKADLATTVKLGPQTIKSSIPLSLTIANFRIDAGAKLDSQDPNANPKVKSAHFRPIFSIGGEGALVSIPVDLNFQFDKMAGGLASTSSGTIPLDLGKFHGSLEAHIRIALTPVNLPDPLNDVLNDVLDEQGLSIQQLELSIGGSASVRLPVIGKVPLKKFEYAVGFPIPVWGDVNTMLETLEGPVPLSWGDPKAAPAPTAGVDYVAPERAIEAGLAASHMPRGSGVLAVDHHIRVTGRPKPDTYSIEADSSIWTGHYLAAEAFRYAALPSAAALQRVNAALDALTRLFWITEDAVVQDGVVTPVPADQAGKVFGRTALPDTPSTQYTAGPLAKRGCAYVRPAAGWEVTYKGTIKKYATLAAAYSALGVRREPLSKTSLPSGASVRPMGEIWYGRGCGRGRANGPLSRDQYSGVLMGLAYASQLVPDPGVQRKAKGLFEPMLDYLIRHDWNVILAPDNVVSTSFLGNFDKQLALLRVGATIDPGHTVAGKTYAALYQEAAPASRLVWVPVWFSAVDPLQKYFKWNLESAAIGPALFVENDPALRANYMAGYTVMRRAVAPHWNAYFNELRILVEPPAQRLATAASTGLASNPNLSLADEIRSNLGAWVARWTAVKSERGMPLTSVPDPQFFIDLWKRGGVGVYHLLGPEAKHPNAYKAKSPVPADKRVGRGLEFTWQRDPYGVPFDPYEDKGKCDPQQTPMTIAMVHACGAKPFREAPGVDYLLGYWLAMYLHVLPAQE